MATGVEVGRRGPVLVARMDDGKANALTFETLGALRSAVSQASEEGCPLVVEGREGVFSAGFDLAVMRSGDLSSVSALLSDGRSLYRSMLEASVPVVAACTGHALAGGALLLLSADLRIGPIAPCKIGLNEVRIGMSLPEFAVVMARHRLGPRHLTSATCFAEICAGDRAAEVGFLDSVADDPSGAAVAAAEEMITTLSMEAFARTKSRLRSELLGELAGTAAEGPILEVEA